MKYVFSMVIIGTIIASSPIRASLSADSSPRPTEPVALKIFPNEEDLSETYELPTHCLLGLNESYECILPRACVYERLIGNRYGENVIQCYLLCCNDSCLRWVCEDYFYLMQRIVIQRTAEAQKKAKKAATKREAALRDIAQQLLTELPTRKTVPTLNPQSRLDRRLRDESKKRL